MPPRVLELALACALAGLSGCEGAPPPPASKTALSAGPSAPTGDPRDKGDPGDDQEDELDSDALASHVAPLLFEAQLLKQSESFERGGVRLPCDPADSAATQAVRELYEGGLAGCMVPQGGSGRDFDQAFNAQLDVELDRPLRGWQQEALAAYQACKPAVISRVRNLPPIDSTCQPARPGHAAPPGLVMLKFEWLRTISRTVAVEVRDLARAGRHAEALHLVLRLHQLSQAFGRGQVSYMQAAMATVVVRTPLERLRLEMNELAANEGLSRTQIEASLAAIDALLAHEPSITDALRGEHTALALRVYLALSTDPLPLELAQAVALNPEGHSAEIELEAQLGLDKLAPQARKAIGSPIELMWGASITMLKAQERACAGASVAACVQNLDELHQRLKAGQNKALQGSGSGLGLGLGLDANALNPALLIATLKSMLSVPPPKLSSRGVGLELLRLRLTATLEHECPSEAQLASPAFKTLLESRFVAETFVVKRYPKALAFARAPKTWERADTMHEPWRVRCP